MSADRPDGDPHEGPGQAPRQDTCIATRSLLDRHRQFLRRCDMEGIGSLWTYPHFFFANEHTVIARMAPEFRARALRHKAAMHATGYSGIDQTCQNIQSLGSALDLVRLKAQYVGRARPPSDPWTEFRIIRHTPQGARFVAAFNIFGETFKDPDAMHQSPGATPAPGTLDGFLEGWRRAAREMDAEACGRIMEFPNVIIWPSHTEIHTGYENFVRIVREQQMRLRANGMSVNGLRCVQQQAIGASLVLAVLAVSVEVAGAGALPDQHQVVCLRVRADGVRRIATTNIFAPSFLGQLDVSAPHL